MIFLGRSLEDGSENYEVSATLLGRSRFLECVGRHPHQHFRPERSSYHFNRQRTRCQMYAGSGGRGYIGAVIDQETSALSTSRLCQGFSNDKDGARRELALADLHHIDTSGKGAIRKLNQEGQRRAGRLVWQQPAVGYHVYQRRRAILNKSPDFAIHSGTREQFS